jgi:Folate-dependent phosphoribosylglycinamide formyltransferase PurN
MDKANIAIFASGSGSNAENITRYLNFAPNREADLTITAHSPKIEVSLILSNNKDAYVLERAAKLGVASVVFTKKELEQGLTIDNILREYHIDFIILAGFLLKFPERLVKEYSRKIINIHPALLPKYGGKGMYGSNVHKAVIAAGESETGITIHLVDELYDNGEHLFQAKCSVTQNDTPETLAAKIHQLEADHFPAVIYRYIQGL